MPLFTDGNISSLADLRGYESSILNLAGAEGIDLASKLALAQREIALELTSFLLKRGALGLQRELTNVIVTEPLLHAHTLGTLAMIYRDAFNSQLNDRYEGKWRQYTELSRRALKQLFEIGVGITATPVPKPQPPEASAMPGGNRPATTYFVRTACVGLTGTTGELSDLILVQANPGDLLRVKAAPLPPGAIGFVLYAGESEEVVARQNDAPLSDGSVWVSPAAGLRTDLPALLVQGPDYYVSNRQQLLRG